MKSGVAPRPLKRGSPEASVLQHAGSRNLSWRQEQPPRRRKIPLHLIEKPRRGGAVDHVAFRAENAPAMRRRLQTNNIPFEERVQPGSGLVQLFLDDPNGVTVEINFRNEMKPAASRRRGARRAKR